MKKIVAMALAAVLCASFAACGGKAPASEASAAAPPAQSVQAGDSQQEGASDGIQPVQMVVAVHCQSTTLDYAAIEHFCKLVEERSGGKIKPELYGDGVLGDEVPILEQVEVNTVQVATTGFAGLDKYIGPVNCWSVPYLFPNVDAVKDSFSGKLGDAARAMFEEKGIMYVGNTYRGNRQVTSSKPIHAPADVKGLKLRLPDTSAWITVWESMGAIASPIASSEVFTALQTGVVDAQENPISSIYAKSLWEVQDYVIETNHIVDFLAVTMSKQFYDSLNAATQKLIMDCMEESMDYMEQITNEKESQLKQDMIDKGMEFIQVDSAAFGEAAQAGIQKVAAGWEDWVMDAALEVAAKY